MIQLSALHNCASQVAAFGLLQLPSHHRRVFLEHHRSYFTRVCMLPQPCDSDQRVWLDNNGLECWVNRYRDIQEEGITKEKIACFHRM